MIEKGLIRKGFNVFIPQRAIAEKNNPFTVYLKGRFLFFHVFLNTIHMCHTI